MPTPRPNHERRNRGIQPVMLLARREFDVAGHRVAQIDLAVDRTRPGRRMRVLEVRHVDLRAGIERVDHHLTIDGTRDLDPTIEQVARNGSHAPVGFAHVGGTREERREGAGVEVTLAVGTTAQQRTPALFELPGQAGDELQRRGGEDFGVGRGDRSANADPRRRAVTRLGGGSRSVYRKGRHLLAWTFWQVLCLRAAWVLITTMVLSSSVGR